MSLGTPVIASEKEIKMQQRPIEAGSNTMSRLGTPIIVEEKEIKMIQVPLSQRKDEKGQTQQQVSPRVEEKNL